MQGIEGDGYRRSVLLAHNRLGALCWSHVPYPPYPLCAGCVFRLDFVRAAELRSAEDDALSKNVVYLKVALAHAYGMGSRVT